jgi:tRNA C32,U32 (ribose-2'-O)-methylase TrmJ
MQRVYEFIGADAEFTPETDQAYNRGMMPQTDWKFLVSQMVEWWIDRYFMKESKRIEYRRWLRRILNLKRKSVRQEQRSKLKGLFRKDIHKLQSLVDKSFDKWLEKQSANSNMNNRTK